MIRIIKLGNLIYENIEPKVIDENEVWNVPQNEEQLRTCMIDTLNWLTDRYFYAEAEKRGGYKNMGEINYDADQGDPDAQFLRKLYDAIWAKEEELEGLIGQKTFDELLALDLKKLCEEEYNKVVQELEGQ